MRLGRVRYESKYLAIQYFHTEKQWDISWMCKTLEIARASYYKWLHREIPEEECKNIELAALIQEYDDRFGHILGYRRMTQWINHFNGTSYSQKRIRRIMRELGICAQIRKKQRQYPKTKPDQVAENLLRREFNASRPNEKWATDVTEFKIPGANKKLYLSAILDLYDRSPVSYVVSKRNNNGLVFKTYDLAIRANPDAKPLFHSDRGFQYTIPEFKNKLQEQGIVQSMSRVGHCIDNGPTEGFWGIIKTEMFSMYDIYDEASLRKAIDKYFDFYTNTRIQERFGGKTPAQVRSEALSSASPTCYPIAENKRIQKYKARWIA